MKNKSFPMSRKGIIRVLGVITIAAVLLSTGMLTRGKFSQCTRIKDGTLLRSDGLPIKLGYDEWGYNYQAHTFNGYYCDAYRDAEWCQPYKYVRLLMWWNDAWLSNKDCDGDGLLDRHYGHDSYIGSGAWETNHQSEMYKFNGKTCRWEYFVKIVAKPTEEFECPGGNEIWGSFCIIQQIYNDPCGGAAGVEFITTPAGFGYYK